MQKSTIYQNTPKIEMETLNNPLLEIDELEARLEIATMMVVDCWGNACGNNNNCVARGCGVNGCVTNACGSHS